MDRFQAWKRPAHKVRLALRVLVVLYDPTPAQHIHGGQSGQRS
jgi:hypothetical protein